MIAQDHARLMQKMRLFMNYHYKRLIRRDSLAENYEYWFIINSLSR